MCESRPQSFCVLSRECARFTRLKIITHEQQIMKISFLFRLGYCWLHWCMLYAPQYLCLICAFISKLEWKIIVMNTNTNAFQWLWQRGWREIAHNYDKYKLQFFFFLSRSCLHFYAIFIQSSQSRSMYPIISSILYQ